MKVCRVVPVPEEKTTLALPGEENKELALFGKKEDDKESSKLRNFLVGNLKGDVKDAGTIRRDTYSMIPPPIKHLRNLLPQAVQHLSISHLI